MENNRRSVVRKDGDTYVVDLFEGNTLVQSRKLDGKSQLYAEDVSTNWDTGIIQLLVD